MAEFHHYKCKDCGYSIDTEPIVQYSTLRPFFRRVYKLFMSQL